MTKKIVGYPSGLRQQFGDAVAGLNTSGIRYFMGDVISGGNPVYRAGQCLKAINDYSVENIPAKERIKEGLKHAKQHLYHLDGGKRAAILMTPREKNPTYRDAPYCVLAGTSLYEPLGRAITKPALEEGIDTLSLAQDYWYVIEELPKEYNEYFLKDTLKQQIEIIASNASRSSGMDGSKAEEFITDVKRRRDMTYPTFMEVTRWASSQYGGPDNIYQEACEENLTLMRNLVIESKLPTTIDGELLAPAMMISTAAKIKNDDSKNRAFIDISALWQNQFDNGKIRQGTLDIVFQKIEEAAGFDPYRPPPTPGT